MKIHEFETKIGRIRAIGDDRALYRLEFADVPCEGIYGSTPPLSLIEEELHQYLEGTLTEFKTPIAFVGTPFQKKVWQELLQIPYGNTISYLELAHRIGNPRACRAVAQANGANPLVILVPCHRVIQTGGGLGGYSCGIERKQVLLRLEKSLL